MEGGTGTVQGSSGYGIGQGEIHKLEAMFAAVVAVVTYKFDAMLNLS